MFIILYLNLIDLRVPTRLECTLSYESRSIVTLCLICIVQLEVCDGSAMFIILYLNLIDLRVPTRLEYLVLRGSFDRYTMFDMHCSTGGM